jgi:hypothetical protein
LRQHSVALEGSHQQLRYSKAGQGRLQFRVVQTARSAPTGAAAWRRSIIPGTIAHSILDILGGLGEGWR